MVKYRNRIVSVVLIIVSLLNASVGAQTALSSDEKKLTKAVKVKTIKRVTSELASDRFEGRGIMQPGGEAAARWIASEMKKLGLRPLGDNGTYLQSVPFVETVFTDESRLEIGGEKVDFASDWSGPVLFPDGEIDAPLVFVGHGIKAGPRDDLKGVDIRGKCAVVIEGAPAGISTVKWKDGNGLGLAIGTLLAAGVKGIVIISNGRETVPRNVALDFSSRRYLSTPEGAGPAVPVPTLFISDGLAAKIFERSGTTRAEALAKAEAKEFSPFDLKQNVKGTFRKKSTPGKSFNVVGYLEGSDPALKNEAVVFSAHYDAYGILGGKIYNGAADNAIGNGEMFAVAEAFSKMKSKPKRSLIFLSCTGEEAGLLGSRYWAQHPTWDITKVAANLNLDGIGTEIMGPVKTMIGFGATYSTLGVQFDSLTAAYGIQTMEDPIPEQGVFKRSDHYAFVERGIPSLMFVGSPVLTPKEFVNVFEEFEKTKYHQTSDDVYPNWHWAGAKTVADMMAIVGLRIAQAESMPSWTPGNPYSNLKRGDAFKEGP